MKKIIFFIIFVLLFLLFFVSIGGGCSILDVFKPNQPSENIIPLPGNQMWNAVKKSNWLVTISIIGIAAGTFAFLNGSKIGLPAIISCCVSLFMSLAVARFATWMAICGLIGSLVVCGASILLKNRAVTEIIKNVQAIKQIAKKDNVDLVFQNKMKEELLIQSKPTQKLVQQIKNNLKLKGAV